MNADLSAQKQPFRSVVDDAYSSTMAEFRAWSTDRKYVAYVVPAATAPKPGFAIFYTPPKPKPRLLIIGQNPSNFAGRGADLAAQPNGEMLSGKPPTVHSYLGHGHVFANEMRSVFAGHEDLLEDVVGMNVWHFQAVSKAASAPKALRDYCEETTRTLIATMKPKAILCFGKHAFDAVRNGRGTVSISNDRVRGIDLGRSYLWGVAHLTGSYTREEAAASTPIALDAIAAYLSNR